MKTRENKTLPYHHGNLRDELLKAAEQEITDKGIESFSLRSVARRAAVSHNAPAHHFTDVRGMLTALATVGFQRLMRIQKERMAQAPIGETEQFIALGLGYIKFATDYPALFRLMYSSNLPDRNNPQLAEAMEKTLKGLSDKALSATTTEGKKPPPDLKNLVAAWALVHGFADLSNSGILSTFLDVIGGSQEELATEVLKRLKTG